jgi:hypothetical protein
LPTLFFEELFFDELFDELFDGLFEELLVDEPDDFEPLDDFVLPEYL